MQTYIDIAAFIMIAVSVSAAITSHKKGGSAAHILLNFCIQMVGLFMIYLAATNLVN